MAILDSGGDLAAYQLAKLKTGALSLQEAQALRCAYAGLPESEQAIYNQIMDLGICRICDLYGEMVPAGHGPSLDLCQACAEEEDEAGS